MHRIVQLPQSLVQFDRRKVVGVGADMVGRVPKRIEAALQLAAKWCECDDTFEVRVFTVIYEHLHTSGDALL
jgi:hypothetical protein